MIKLKQRLLSLLVLYCFVASSLMATSSDQVVEISQSNLNSMKNLIVNLTSQRDYLQTELQKQRKILVQVESYSMSQGQLSTLSRNLTQEEQDLIKSTQASLVSLTKKLSQVSQALTQAQEALQNYKELNKKKDKLYQISLEQNETLKKKATFWGIVYKVLIGIGTLLGAYGGYQLNSFI